MRRVSKRPTGPIRAGSLLADVGVIAKKIYVALVDGDVVVWADAQTDIWYAQSGETTVVGAIEMVGSYRMGASVQDIEDDLRELRKSRASDSIIF
jgi:hypothetical protein